jgi:hypothetical protein
MYHACPGYDLDGMKMMAVNLTLRLVSIKRGMTIELPVDLVDDEYLRYVGCQETLRTLLCRDSPTQACQPKMSCHP